VHAGSASQIAFPFGAHVVCVASESAHAVHAGVGSVGLLAAHDAAHSVLQAVSQMQLEIAVCPSKYDLGGLQQLKHSKNVG
jgi:hypothetical protein